MTKQAKLDSSRAFEVFVGSKLYFVRMNGRAITVLYESVEYARGTWVEFGGYVRYAGDGVKSSYNWHIFDAIDLLLRRDLRWVPPRVKLKHVRDVLALLTKKDAVGAHISKWDGT